MSKHTINEMFVLEINKEACTDCGNCEKILPKFKTTYAGRISVSAWAYQRDDVRESVKSLTEACPACAITIR